MRREPYRDLTRRRFLRSTGVGLSAIALTDVARAQHATQPPPKPIPPDVEGIDAHVTPEGDTVLTMVSDDNFSMIQRTLLLQFTLVG